MSREPHSLAPGPTPPPEGGPVAAFLHGAGRDRIPGALPVISYREEDEHDFLDDLERCAGARVELLRRGRWHGSWAELSPDAAGVDLEAELTDHGALHGRWLDARPIVLPAILDAESRRAGDARADAFELYHESGEDGGLRRWLRAHISRLGPDWRVRDRREDRSDPERDLEKVVLTDESIPGGARDLWWKSGRLSDFELDDSLRVRLSFGRERDDDASRELGMHRAVSEMAEELLPGADLLAEEEALWNLVELFAGEELFPTQHIGYWNAPEGGALFHHDAFDEESDGGQRGVIYAQLAGRTAWLALSITDLASRVQEFLELLADGELPWVREQLFPREPDLVGALECARDDARLLRELALPGCGRFAALVNRGPEFTDYLANAGHALLLEAGDVLLLPNFGLARTAMHSVFCADDAPTYAVSAALRQERPTIPPPQTAGVPSRRRANGKPPRRAGRR